MKHSRTPDLNKRCWLRAAGGALAAAALAACSQSTPSADKAGATDAASAAAPASAASAAAANAAGGPLKIGFIYVGPVGDGGWTFAHDNGRKAVEAEFGDKVQTSIVESVPEGPDAERVARDLAGQGNQLIFATSFGFMDPTLKAAKDFANVKFEHATGYKTAANFAAYDSRTYEGAYMAGVLAGHWVGVWAGRLGRRLRLLLPPLRKRIEKCLLGLQLQGHGPCVRQMRPELDGIFFGAEQGGVACQQPMRLLQHVGCVGMVGQGSRSHHLQACGTQHGKKALGLCNAGQGNNRLTGLCPLRQCLALPGCVDGCVGQCALGAKGGLSGRKGQSRL